MELVLALAGADDAESGTRCPAYFACRLFGAIVRREEIECCRQRSTCAPLRITHQRAANCFERHVVL